ncbi:MAG: FeoB-associated Cys-rich membrane protein [Deltaproteobacteria bacterium]|jgi:hypothetical protein|nr:FeoB-associated Cys-rich membrane protein [Deltaproteobacteria bacterium]
METIIVILVIAAAMALCVYKIFIKPSCNCGCEKCKPTKADDDEPKFDPLAE